LIGIVPPLKPTQDPANSSEGTRFPFGPGVELNSCYVPQRNNFLDLANKAKMARQRDPAGMEKPPGCEPDGL
jgi:hypothetical protein